MSEETTSYFYNDSEKWYVELFYKFKIPVKAFISMDEQHPKRIYVFHALIAFEIITVALFLSTSNIPLPLNFSTLATVLASVLAIIFAISLVAVQFVSNNYSPRIIDTYKENKWVYGTLALFVGSIISLILFSTIPKPTPLLNSICFSLFFICSYIFVNYFFQILKIIDPLKLADLLEQESEYYIKSGDYEKITLMQNCVGDITIKTIERKEELITKRYLTLLWHNFETFLELDREKRKKLSEAHPFIIETKRDLTNHINAEFFRIFRMSVLKNEPIISSEIFEIYGQIIHKCLKDSPEIFNSVVDFEINALVLAEDKKDESRFTFIQQFIAQPLMFMVRGGDPGNPNFKKYLDEFFILSTRIAIHNDDFEFFMTEMDEVYSWPFGRYDGTYQGFIEALENPNLEDLYSSLFEENPALIDEINRKHSELKDWSLIYFMQDYENYGSFIERIDKFEIFIVDKIRPADTIIESEIIENTKANLRSLIDGIKYSAKDLYFISIFYRTFFLIGTYITTRKKIPNFDTKRYFLTFWADPNVISGEESPFEPFVVQNTNWLTHMLLFGGEGNEDWLEKRRMELHLNIDDDSLFEFYLICITKNQTNAQYHLTTPNRAELQRIFNIQNNTATLSHYYNFSQRFIDKSEKLKQICEKLIQNAGEYDFLFNNLAKERFEETKKWLEESIQRCSQLTNDIESIIPVDREIKNDYLKEINSSFERLDRLKEFTQVRTYDIERDSTKPFIKIYNPKNLSPKRNFIRSFYVPIIGLGRAIAWTILNGEFSHIASVILSDTRIEKIEIAVDSIPDLFAHLPSIIKRNYSHQEEISILISDLLLSQLREIKLVSIPTQIIINDDWIAKIHHSEKIPYNQIIFLYKNAGTYIQKTQQETQSRLFTEIKEYENDKTKVLVQVWVLSHYTIDVPEKVRVVQFSLEYPNSIDQDRIDYLGAMDCWQVRGQIPHD